MSLSFDYALVGGGLQSGLIALALLDAEPALRIAVIEQGNGLGGNHTWCFHERDVPKATTRAFAPLVVHRWRGHEVRFPGLHRRLSGDYCAVTSERLDAVVRERLVRSGGAVVLGRRAVRLTAKEVEVEGGEIWRADRIVDARGRRHDTADAGYQVFLGQEVLLDAPHRLERPILIDAEVEQIGGFRFLYVLPLADDRLLLEDTVFADEPALDEGAMRERIGAYATQHGYSIARVGREERGVLPMPWAGGPRPRPEWPLEAGYRGGFFHPATGYSFPVAARLAAALASDPRAGGGAALTHLCDELEGPQTFARALNRLAFRCFEPHQRWNPYAQFYRLPEPVLARFYSLESTRLDMARTFLAGPPRGFTLSRASRSVKS